MMKKENLKISKNFWLSEFNYVMPDLRLLAILQTLRDKLNTSVTITDSSRDFMTHYLIYKSLSDEHKINTLENGLGDKPLIDCIPFRSRHLAQHNKPYLRAVDIASKKSNTEYYTGEDLKEVILNYVNSAKYYNFLIDNKFKKETDRFIGVGVGNHYIHLDIDRDRYTEWAYGY
jgi:hypothetical protein